MLSDSHYCLIIWIKYNNFLEQLQSALRTQSKLGETAIMCYSDICRAAFYIPPHTGDNVLRSLAPELADELKVFSKHVTFADLMNIF